MFEVARNLSSLEAMPPGPELAGLLDAVDPTRISDPYDLVELVAACRRLKAWADAIEVQSAAAVARHPVATPRRRHSMGSARSGPPVSCLLRGSV
jgi:hypothetical protein